MEQDRENDPNYVPSLDEFWGDVETNIARRRSQPSKKARTPHSQLKSDMRKALMKWRTAHNLPAVLLPSIVGQIKVDDGTKQGKEIFVGKKGQADDAYLIMGHAFAFEVKAGRDQQSNSQRRFQERWEAAGGTYVIVRKPTDGVDAVVLWAASVGKIF